MTDAYQSDHQDQNVSKTFDRFNVLFSQFSAWGEELASLFVSELSLAAKSLPKIFVSKVIIAVLSLFGWILLNATVCWFVYSVSNLGFGLLSSLVLHGIAIAILVKLSQYYKQQIKFTMTRAECSAMLVRVAG